MTERGYGIQELPEENYNARLDSHKPKFKGIPPNFYVNTWGNVILIWFMILGVYAICGGLFAGLVIWAMNYTVPAVWTFVGVFVGYVLILIIGVYFGSRVRAKKEKQMIEAKLREQEEEIRKMSQSQKAIAPQGAYNKF